MPDNPLKIIIMGGPASGKGTQCEKIVEKFKVVHLSTGDLLREAVAAESDVGVTAKKYMDVGELVPDEIMIQIVKNRLSRPDVGERGWLLDGFPRTRAQADALTSMGIFPDIFLLLQVPDAMLVERVTGRRMDKETGKIYHLKFNPPPPDIPEERLLQRSDDTVEKVKVRIQHFNENAASISQVYERVTVKVEGSGTPDEVGVAVEKAISDSMVVSEMAAA